MSHGPVSFPRHCEGIRVSLALIWQSWCTCQILAPGCLAPDNRRGHFVVVGNGRATEHRTAAALGVVFSVPSPQLPIVVGITGVGEPS